MLNWLQSSLTSVGVHRNVRESVENGPLLEADGGDWPSTQHSGGPPRSVPNSAQTAIRDGLSGNNDDTIEHIISQLREQAAVPDAADKEDSSGDDGSALADDAVTEDEYEEAGSSEDGEATLDPDGLSDDEDFDDDVAPAALVAAEPSSEPRRARRAVNPVNVQRVRDVCSSLPELNRLGFARIAPRPLTPENVAKFGASVCFERSIFVFAPAHAAGNLRCPWCGDATAKNGFRYDRLRSVVGDEQSDILCAAELKCCNRNRHCGKRFPASHPRVLQALPARFRDAFPFHLTHCGGVTKKLLLMITLNAHRLSEWREHLKQVHAHAHFSTHAQYLQLLAEHPISLDVFDPKYQWYKGGIEESYSWETDFADPNGWGGYVPSMRYFRTVAMKYFETHREPLLRREFEAVQIGRHLAWDKTYNVAVRVNACGNRVFNAAFTVMNEYHQVVAQGFTMSDSAEEVTHTVRDLHARWTAQGCEPIVANATDSCCKVDKGLFAKVFSGPSSLFRQFMEESGLPVDSETRENSSDIPQLELPNEKLISPADLDGMGQLEIALSEHEGDIMFETILDPSSREPLAFVFGATTAVGLFVQIVSLADVRHATNRQMPDALMRLFETKLSLLVGIDLQTKIDTVFTWFGRAEHAPRTRRDLIDELKPRFSNVIASCRVLQTITRRILKQKIQRTSGGNWAVGAVSADMQSWAALQVYAGLRLLEFCRFPYLDGDVVELVHDGEIVARGTLLAGVDCSPDCVSVCVFENVSGTVQVGGIGEWLLDETQSSNVKLPQQVDIERSLGLLVDRESNANLPTSRLWAQTAGDCVRLWNYGEGDCALLSILQHLNHPVDSRWIFEDPIDADWNSFWHMGSAIDFRLASAEMQSSAVIALRSSVWAALDSSHGRELLQEAFKRCSFLLSADPESVLDADHVEALDIFSLDHAEDVTRPSLGPEHVALVGILLDIDIVIARTQYYPQLHRVSHKIDYVGDGRLSHPPVPLILFHRSQDGGGHYELVELRSNILESETYFNLFDQMRATSYQDELREMTVLCPYVPAIASLESNALNRSASYRTTLTYKDIFHVLHLLKVSTKNHLASPFLREVSEAILPFVAEDEETVRRFFMSERGMSLIAFNDFKFSKVAQKFLPRHSRDVTTMVAKLFAIREKYEALLDSRGRRLFTPVLAKNFTNMLKHAAKGCFVDPPVGPRGMYERLGVDKATGLMTYRSLRGTNHVENYHKQLRKLFQGITRISPAFAHMLFIEINQRVNVKAGVRFKLIPYIGTTDLWLCDRVNRLHKQIFGDFRFQFRKDFHRYQIDTTYSHPMGLSPETFADALLPLRAASFDNANLQRFKEKHDKTASLLYLARHQHVPIAIQPVASRSQRLWFDVFLAHMYPNGRPNANNFKNSDQMAKLWNAILIRRIIAGENCESITPKVGPLLVHYFVQRERRLEADQTRRRVRELGEDGDDDDVDFTDQAGLASFADLFEPRAPQFNHAESDNDEFINSINMIPMVPSQPLPQRRIRQCKRCGSQVCPGRWRQDSCTDRRASGTLILGRERRQIADRCPACGRHSCSGRVRGFECEATEEVQRAHGQRRSEQSSKRTRKRSRKKR